MASLRTRLFDLNPEIKKLLTKENFKENVSTTEFMETITNTIIQELKTDSNGKVIFDPKPFIRTFEQVLEELKLIRTNVQSQCKELDISAQAAEKQYKDNVKGLQDEFEQIYRAYDDLENRTGVVGKTAVRIGEQLETIDKQRSRAAESVDIVEYYMDFKEGSSERLDSLMEEGGDEGQIKAAIIARRLNAVAKEIDSDKEAGAAIELFCENFEKKMLHEFDHAYKDGDPRVMSHCAKVLFEFNGGSSCVQTYVNQHEFFMSNVKIGDIDELKDLDDLAELSNPGATPPEVDTGLMKLYDDIRITVRREAEIIATVFPQPAIVIQVFLQRIFAQSIQTYIESLLSRAEKHSQLAYLRTLSSAHAATSQLIDNLKLYCAKEVSLKNSADVSGLVVIASPEETLDRCMADLFVPYTESNRYLGKELASLQSLFDGIVGDFLNYMQRRKKATTLSRSQSVLTRTLGQISSSTSTTSGLAPPGNTDSASSSLSPTNPFDRSHDSNGTRGSARDKSSYLEHISGDVYFLSRNAIYRLLKIHSEAIVRCVELVDAQDQLSAIQTLYGILVVTISDKYLDKVLDTVLDGLSQRTEPELVCFPATRTCMEIVQLMQQHFECAIVPLVVRAPSVHKSILATKNTFMSSLEERLNGMLGRCIHGIVEWLSELLARQKRNDFRPRDEEVVMMSMGTQPCVQCVDFLTRVYHTSSKALQSKNLEAFLFKAGVAFHGMLLEHFKKYTVTLTGGLLVTKDLAKYQEVIHMFKIPALDEMFEMLRHLGNLFVVKPEILRSILSEGYLARLSPEVLSFYLEKRADFKTAKLDRALGFAVDDQGVVQSDTVPAMVSSSSMSTSAKSSQRRSLFVNDSMLSKDTLKSYRSHRDFLSAFHLS